MRKLRSALVRFTVWIFGTVNISIAALTGYSPVDTPNFLTLLTILTLVYGALFLSVLHRTEWNARRYAALSLEIVTSASPSCPPGGDQPLPTR